VEVDRPGQLSPDGHHYWDGQRWMPTLSADGRWRWDGATWIAANPTSPTTATAAAPAAPIYQAAPMYASPVLVYGPPTNTWAVVSLVSGILSWFLCPFVGGVVAVISGHVGQSQIKRSGEGGGGLATAVLVLGYFHLAIFALIAVFWLFVFGGIAILGGIGAGTSH